MEKLYTLERINSLIKAWGSGFITESEYCDKAYDLFERAFIKYRDEFAERKYHWTDDDMFFLEEGFDSWLNGEITERFGTGNEFFELLKAVGFPRGFLEPLPIGLDFPYRDIIITRSSGSSEIMWLISCRYVDDDGLFYDEDPIGQTFILRNDIDQETKVKVLGAHPASKRDFYSNKKIRKTERDIDSIPDEDRVVVYECVGYIEGYTSDKRYFEDGETAKREEAYIYVYVDQFGEIYGIKLFPVMDDETAIRSYPLWKDYFEWLDNKKLSLRNALIRYKDKRIKGEG
jgi:hypothetical protein